MNLIQVLASVIIKDQKILCVQPAPTSTPIYQQMRSNRINFLKIIIFTPVKQINLKNGKSSKMSEM